MSQPASRIERLLPPVDDDDLHSLAVLLVDAVESGAAVSFLEPLPLDRAQDWWRGVLAHSHSGAVFLAARDAGEIVGTVQLHPAWAPNQPHRAEIAKLLVHRRCRRSGLATELMQGAEEVARRAGFRLLTLDAKSGGIADRLYRRLGWTAVGTIPGYALDPDGETPHDAVFFYKELEPLAAAVPRIRTLAPGDWRIYRNLRLRALHDSPDAFGRTLPEEEAYPDTEWSGRLVAGADPRWNLPLVAEVEGEPIGLAWGRIEPPHPEVATLYQMWVSPRRRRLGAARMLLRAVVDWSRAQGASQLRLGVTCGDSPARRLYESIGFRAAGDPEPLRPGSPLSAQPMRLSLDDGGT